MVKVIIRIDDTFYLNGQCFVYLFRSQCSIPPHRQWEERVPHCWTRSNWTQTCHSRSKWQLRRMDRRRPTSQRMTCPLSSTSELRLDGHKQIVYWQQEIDYYYTTVFGDIPNYTLLLYGKIFGHIQNDLLLSWLWMPRFLVICRVMHYYCKCALMCAFRETLFHRNMHNTSWSWQTTVLSVALGLQIKE